MSDRRPPAAREPADAEARREALDPTRSFIVQAPAGSGKTGLLTQRFLRLLAGVKDPEEIVAITFTKKAAAEMRNRILDALRGASEKLGSDPNIPSNGIFGSDPNFCVSPHHARTRELARAALARDRAEGWNLIANPQRLRIQTIDSFNAALTRQMPLLTRLGAQPMIVEDARDHHLEAARLALEPHDDLTWGEAVKTLHGHLDGDLGRAQRLIAGMLGSRDQWIWHFAEGQQGLSRDDLEAALARAVHDELAAVAAVFPAETLGAALDLIQVAASNLAGSDKAGSDTAVALIRAAELAASGVAPSTDPATLPLWQGLATLFLKDDDALRSPKGVDVRLGFPTDPATRPHKQRLQDLLEGLAGDEVFATTLARVRALPPTRYSDAHWKVLGAFVEVLRHAFAMLERVFQATGEVDFSEVSLRALKALRDGEMPTDLALALDHRIGHLLVDEFQDTSKNQLFLLERLTEGWAAGQDGGDGRTLFVVGDPMQSIYRFRKAEVSLFTQAMAHGIGSVPLTTLRLTENFRSQQRLVDWTNATFKDLFPERADPAVGAVPFAPATASHPALEGEAVEVHPLFSADAASEAALVVQLTQRALAAGHGSVAILVAARAHLRQIMPALKAAGITPRVTDIEPLSARPMVRDLVALTRALVHAGDRTAWLAVLRAPWCGLSLADLLKLGSDPNIHAAATLSPESAARFHRVEQVFAAARAQHRRISLTRLVQGAWLALGGPSCARDAEDLADARAYFDFLGQHDVAGDLDDPAALEQLMEQLHAPEAPDADPRVQVLTMHKAKGLEFDTVILPGLQRIGRGDETQLLRWLDRPASDGLDLMMAALAATGAERDPIYDYVGELTRQQRAAEQLRQLYVATTRPKQRLHLIGQATIGKDGTVKRPPTGSLLRAMWDVVAERFEDAAATAAVEEGGTPERATPSRRFRRLPADWQAPALPAPIAVRPLLEEDEAEPYEPFDEANQTHRIVGIVVHRLLQRIAEDGLEKYAEPLLDWDPDQPDVLPPEVKVDPRVQAKRAAAISTLWPAAESLLEREGLAEAERPKAIAQVKEAVTNTLSDATGRWILSPHPGSASEQSLTLVQGGSRIQVRFDRTCVVARTCWVFDFKTSPMQGSGVEAFLVAQRTRHAEQLARYEAVARGAGHDDVRTTLYFPLLKRMA